MTSTPCHDWLITSGGEDIWHPDNRTTSAATRLAKRICRTCPVQTEALTYEANNPHNMRHGVWGGLDAEQRAQLAKATA